MEGQSVRPAWWKLYLILAVGIGLMVAVAQAPLSTVGLEAAECGLLLLTYGLVWLWLRASRMGLLQASREGAWQPRTKEQRFVGQAAQAASFEAVRGGPCDENRPGAVTQPSSERVEIG